MVSIDIPLARPCYVIGQYKDGEWGVQVLPYFYRWDDPERVDGDALLQTTLLMDRLVKANFSFMYNPQGGC